MSGGLILGLTFALAAGASLVAAGYAVSKVEDGTEIGVRRALDRAELDWAEVEADGLRVILSGTAPDEATRFDVMTTAGRVVDAARLIDEMDVAATADLAPPRFSAEILRNASGVSVIGLVPAATDRAALGDRLAAIPGLAAPDAVADFLETAAYPAPQGWDAAMAFAVTALERLPRSKISVAPGRVEVTAMTDSEQARTRITADLRRAAPPGLTVALDISAPRPVIAPFSLRFVLDANGGRFDACSAPDEAAAAAIIDAARAAGLTAAERCTIGLGAPSPSWARAAGLSLDALRQLGGGTLTMTDTDIALAAGDAIAPGLFDQIVGELETALPPVFSLHAVLPAPEIDSPEGPAEFYATLSPEGLVQLRGRLPSDNVRQLADSFARARFGSENVYTGARVVDDLPADWTTRALAGLEALGELTNGVVTVTEDTITVRGVSGREDASAVISRLFASKLGDTAAFDLSIAYREPPPPKDEPLSGEDCEAQISGLLAINQITFEPGSATIAEDSIKTIDAIAEILDRCAGVPIEIQGHTDSQGRESMNLDLSQDRADAVLAELAARRIRTASFRARGYGESLPIAENDTEEGREANRRIEFRLIRSADAAEHETTLDSLSAPAPEAPPPAGADDAADPAGDAAATPPDAAAPQASEETADE